MSAILRVVGVMLPIPVTMLVLTRGALVGDAIFWWLVLIGFSSGLLLRTWWALLVVPAVNLGTWVVAAIAYHKHLFSDDFSIVGSIFVVTAMHTLIAICAALGTWAGKVMEQRISIFNSR